MKPTKGIGHIARLGKVKSKHFVRKRSAWTEEKEQRLGYTRIVLKRDRRVRV